MAEFSAHILERIAELVAAQELVLLDIVRRGQTNSTVVEVIVDNESGVDLDTLAGISREIGQLLDSNEEEIKGRYRLEVSTPGLDRPLEHDWQFRKNRGRLVKVSYLTEERIPTTGLFRLQETDSDSLTLLPAPKPGKKGKRPSKSDSSESVTLPMDRIERVVVEPEL